MVRIGERLSLSTFGAVSDKLKVSNLYLTFEWSQFCGNLGGNTDSFRPMFYGVERIFLCSKFEYIYKILHTPEFIIFYLNSLIILIRRQSC